MDEFDLSQDSVPTFTLRSVLIEIDMQLQRDEVETLKFLNTKILPVSKLERIDRGLQLFECLEAFYTSRGGRINSKFTQVLAELLYLIRRYDLLRLLNYDRNKIETELRNSGSCIDSFWQLLYRISDVTCSEYEMMKSLSKPYLSSRNYDNITSAQELFIILVRMEVISKDKLELLEKMSKCIRRPDLQSDILDFKSNNVSSVQSSDTKFQSKKRSGIEQFEKHAQFDLEANTKKQYVTDKSLFAVSSSNRNIKEEILNNEIKDFNIKHPHLHIPFNDVCQSNQKCNEEINLPVIKAEARPVEGTEEVKESQSELPPETTPHSNSLPLSVLAAGLPDSLSPPPRAEHNVLHHIIQPCPETGDRVNGLHNLEIYPMNTSPKGLVVIINNELFERNRNYYNLKQLNERRGSSIDRDKLQSLFTKLGFEIIIRDNLSSSDFLSFLKEVSSKNHSIYSCFVCCLLSHGEEGVVYGSDCMGILIKDITSFFTAENCPSLVGRPKLFFIQACQGKIRQKGYPASSSVEMDSPSYAGTIPNEADFLLSYATVPGYVSFRSRELGSWYISSLVSNIEKYANTLDILHILLNVNKEVSAAVAKLDTGCFKQMPGPMYTLTKKLYFGNIL